MNLRTAIASISLTAGLLIVNGCGVGKLAVPTAVPGIAFNGKVFGGQQPVAGVALQLYTVGSTGYGSGYASYVGGPSLFGANTPTTDASGNFSVTGMYTCPLGGDAMVYLVGTGGTPITGQPANTNLAMMAALGRCGDLGPSTFINMNELTTVAAVWALAPFMTDAAHIGASSTNSVGLVNAFATARKLVDTSTGSLRGPTLPTDAILPSGELNTLANMLAFCVNSTGATGSGAPCDNLFALTHSTLGVAPTDTIQAALNIAQNPAQNVTSLNMLPPPQSPFQPGTGGIAPAAWTVAIRYPAANQLSAPVGIAADQAGEIWIANTGAGNVLKLDTNGALLSGSTGFGASLTSSGTIAIDTVGNAWTPGVTTGSIVRLSSSGTPTTFAGANLGTINSLAIDAQGLVWAASASGLSAFDPSGTEVSGSGYTGGGMSGPSSIAISPR